MPQWRQGKLFGIVCCSTSLNSPILNLHFARMSGLYRSHRLRLNELEEATSTCHILVLKAIKLWKHNKTSPVITYNLESGGFVYSLLIASFFFQYGRLHSRPTPTSSLLSSPLTRVSTPPFLKLPDAPSIAKMTPLAGASAMVIGDKSKAQLSRALPSNCNSLSTKLIVISPLLRI